MRFILTREPIATDALWARKHHEFIGTVEGSAGAIYDNDISGTRETLLARADFLIASWEDLTADEFLGKLRNSCIICCD